MAFSAHIRKIKCENTKRKPTQAVGSSGKEKQNTIARERNWKLWRARSSKYGTKEKENHYKKEMKKHGTAERAKQ